MNRSARIDLGAVIVIIPTAADRLGQGGKPAGLNLTRSRVIPRAEGLKTVGHATAIRPAVTGQHEITETVGNVVLIGTI